MVFHHGGEFADRRRVINVSTLGDIGQGHMMIHQQDQHFTLGRIKLQSPCHSLGEHGTGLRMRPGPDRLAGIMQQKGKIEDERIGELFEQFPIFE